MKETKTERTLQYKGDIISFFRDDVILEDGKKTQRDVISFNNHKGSVHCLCIDEEDNVIYTQQKRFNSNIVSISTIGGLIEENETPLQSVCREINEETGYDIISIKKVSNICPLVAYSYEKSFLYIAKVKYTGKSQKLDEFEDIKVGKSTVEEFYSLTKSNKCSSMNAKILINYYKLIKSL